MNRRAPALLAAIAVIVAVFATAAYAAEITGTDKSDQLFESQRSDVIHGLGGADTIRAEKFHFDTDKLYGDKGPDVLRANDGDNKDTLDGGDGTDQCKGDQFDTYISCELRK
jgi:hypothetical protein